MKCMIEECKRLAVCRGLCWACYQKAVRYVKSGRTTWDQLVSAGFAKATNRSPYSNPLGKEFEKKFPLPESDPTVQDIEKATGNKELMYGVPPEEKEQQSTIPQTPKVCLMSTPAQTTVQEPQKNTTGEKNDTNGKTTSIPPWEDF